VTDDPRPRILCVDDDRHLLDGLERTLRRSFDVSVASSGPDGLALIESSEPFAVIVSDMRMPAMDGAAFLRHARERSPLSVRILLTGQAELADAVRAVNDGAIFRFLTKPCEHDALMRALDAAVEQYQLVNAERVLLEETLHGSIKALTEVLAMAHPAAFGRATRLKSLASELAVELDVPDRWQIEIAAMVSQLGCVTLPGVLADRAYRGSALDEREQELVDRLPETSARLLANIPRMDSVARIVAYQDKRYNGQGVPRDRVSGDDIPFGARILKVVGDFDLLEGRGFAGADALAYMRERHGWYDASILNVFIRLRHATGALKRTLDLPLAAVETGMVFVHDVVSDSGTLLIARGITMTPTLAERVQYLPINMRVSGRVRVRDPRPPRIRPAASFGVRARSAAF
jgi:response regulator RpfG family c-di-GMP phosphodiesterase